jgi:hypothetical protein
VDWCSYEAAKYAVMHWHYSKAMPLGRLATLGAWEAEEFVGSVVFGRGNSTDLGSSYGLKQGECAELVRVALQKHLAPVSRIISVALRLLRKRNPGLRLLVSFADPNAGHHGGIYQAGGWLYAGLGGVPYEWQHKGTGERIANREYSSRVKGSPAFGKAGSIGDSSQWKKIALMPKHRYLYPLDDAMRKQIEPLRQPYPKRPPARGTLANEGRQCEPDPAAPDIEQQQDVT